jgi:hypothetical protein
MRNKTGSTLDHPPGRSSTTEDQYTSNCIASDQVQFLGPRLLGDAQRVIAPKSSATLSS